MNQMIVCKSCTNDSCAEPTKRKIGHGSRYVTGIATDKHVTAYSCDKEDCKKQDTR